jgi:choline dehydrogenase-like flavoprotein
MDQNISTKTLIVGGGFCGKSVAMQLSQDYIVIDKGEPIQHEQLPVNYQREYPPVDSKITPTVKMGVMDSNWQSYVSGGNSNWWGGWASRITPETFTKRGELQWDRSYASMEKCYEKAEKLLNTHGDTVVQPSLIGEIPGAAFWREWSASLFQKAYVTSETKNFTREDIGKCLGRGTCRACPENAKTMPWHLPVEVMGHSTSLKEIKMNDGLATSAIVNDGVSDMEIFFDNLVIASGGYENVKWAKQFNSSAGNYFQDHASGTLLVKLPKEVPYRKIAAESHLVIEDVLVNHREVEIKSIMLTAEPEHQFLACSKQEVTDENREMFATVWMQIEIPPEWNLQMKTRESNFYVDYTSYVENLHVIDEAVEKVKQKFEDLGIIVCAEELQYRYSFGGYHLSGTTAIGKVVDTDCKIIGTENIYIAGASVVPRSGGSGPSLTAVALAIELGEHLNKL